MELTHLVSVIIPTHNRVDSFMRAIGSVQEQTYKHLEIIVVLDGCTDATGEKVDLLLTQDRRIVKIENAQSIGGLASRIKGIRTSKGKYIAFLDDDDLWMAEKIEKQIIYLEKNNDVEIVGCDYFNESSKGMQKSGVPTGLITLEDMKFSNYLGSFSFCLTRAVSYKNIRFDERLRSCQDWFVWLSLMISGREKSYILEDKLCIYDNGDHERISNNTDSKIQGYNYILSHFNNVLKKNHKSYINFLKQQFLLKSQPRFKGRVRPFFSGMVSLIGSHKEVWNGSKIMVKHLLKLS